MNAQSILTRIEQDAKGAASDLLKDAQARAEAIRKASEQRIEKARTAALEQARKDAVEMDSRMARMASLEERKALLAAKREVLDEAFEQAYAKMVKMDDAQARAFGLSLITGAARGEETVLADSASPWCDEAFIKAANEALVKAGKPGRLTLSGETRSLGGGFVLLSGGMEVRCTYRAAIEAQRMGMEAEIAALLFG